jgi:metal-responsive CopG/Arc/MetJ family transcriptional regulator
MPDRSQKRSERIQLMLDEDELEAIDNWRFDNRLPSRAAAIRELIKRGLLNRDLEPPQTKDAKTTDFSVVPEFPDGN